MTKHAWLAIDPGITTGWALLADDGTILATSVWGTHELKSSLDTMVRYAFTSGYSLDAVVEQMPSTGGNGVLARKLEWVRQQIKEVLTNVYEIPTHHILPGTWKPSRVARTTTLPARWADEPLMTHQKDAIRMGRFAIDSRPRFARASEFSTGLAEQYR